MDPRGTSLGRRSKHYGPIRGTPQTPQNGEGAPPGAAPPSPAQAEKAAEKGAEFVTLFYGEDVTEEQAQAAEAVFARNCPDAELSVLPGGQPVYYYIVSIE